MSKFVSLLKCDIPSHVETLFKSSDTDLVPLIANAVDGKRSLAVDSGTTSKGCGFHFRRQLVSLQWHSLTHKSSKGIAILKNASGIVNSDEIMAIMGPSGAGKSSLLNCLSGFTRSGMNGSITLNGVPRDMRVFRKLSCYVMQDDFLLPQLTVRESIYFAAMLKIPSSVSKQEKLRQVDNCLEALGLTERQSNKISQISGGQRKRLCIAQEIVSNPTVIFLDEPISGLDSSSGLRCIQLLKSLAKGNRIVVCTIHQPNRHIFELFDKLYILAEGHCIYNGSTKNLDSYLRNQGLFCPTSCKPEDFVIQVATEKKGDWFWKLKTANDNYDATKNWSVYNGSFIVDDNSVFELPSSDLNQLKDQESILNSSIKFHASNSWNQFRLLTHRNIICKIRDPLATKLILIAHVGIGVLMGSLCYGIGNDATRMLNNCGLLFFSLLFLIFTSMMPTILTFPMEKTITVREHFNWWYSLKIYYLAKTVSELLFQNAAFLGPSLTIPIILFCGYFITISKIPIQLQWLSYVSYVRFGYHSVLHCIYDLGRPKLHCENICLFEEPQDILHEMDMADGSIFVDYAAMLVFFIILRVISFYLLYYKIIYYR